MTRLTSDALLHEPFTWLYGRRRARLDHADVCDMRRPRPPRKNTTPTRHANKPFNLYLGFPEIDTS